MAELQNQKLPFLFEVWHEDFSTALKSFLVPYNPETYRYTERPRVSVTQTRGGYFEDHGGLGLPKIMFSGNTGLYGSLRNKGKAKHAEGQSIDGVTIAKEFKDLILDFYREANTTYKDDQDKFSIRFYNFTDELFLEVSIEQFELMRSVSHRSLYKYNIVMTGISRLDEPTPTENLLKDLFYPPDMTLNVRDLGTWGTLLKAYTNINTAISDVINDVDDLRTGLDQINTSVVGFRNGLSRLIEAPFGLVSDAVETVNTIRGAIESLTEIPHEFKSLINNTKRKLTQLENNRDRFVNPIQSTASGVKARTSGYEVVSKELPANNPSVVKSGALGMDIPEITLFDENIDEASDIAQSEEAVRGNDTLQTIAQRVMGDATQWRRIAFLNDLEYPFIVQKGSPDIVTEQLEEDVLDLSCSIGDIHIVSDLEVYSGGVVAFWSGDTILEVRTVDGIELDGGQIIKFKNTMNNAFPANNKITFHDRERIVAIQGEKIKIPATTGSVNSFGIQVDGTVDEKLYFSDERVDVDGNSIVTGTGEREVLSGMPNLEMQLKHRMETVKGELAQIGHPEYGSLMPTLIGKVTDEIWLERAKLEAKISILSDPRIDRVDSLEFRVDGSAIFIEGDVTPINQSQTERISLVLGRG